ncbi:MAG: flagellar hook-length control protein FliK [Planctomycetota bacterium]|jgi:flagellar hook-length control protein FliK
MNTDLLAISNIFTGTNGNNPAPVKPKSTNASKQFSPSTPDNTLLTDPKETETADNTYVDPQNEPQNGTPSEFDPAPDAKAPQKNENSNNTAKQNLTQIPAEQPSLVQAWLAQYSLNIEQGKEGLARKVEPKAGYELAQSLKNLKQEIAFAHAVKPATTQISETVPNINQNQIGLKTALPATSKKLSNEGEQPYGIQISNAKLAASRGYADQQSSNDLALKVLANVNSKITAAGNKPVIIVDIGIEKKDSIDRPGHPGTQQPSGSLADDIFEQGENVTGKSLSRNLHNLQLQVSAGQIKEHGGSASNNKSDSGFEQIISTNYPTTSIEEQSSLFPDIVTTDNQPTQALSSDVSINITKQILGSIQGPSSQQPGTQQITIRLNPPELGKVFIKFEEQENQIIGLLEVSKAQTRYEVEQTLPQIIQNLADSGIQVKRLEVALTDQGEQQPYKDESLQDGTFRQNQEFSQESNPDDPGFMGT